MGFICMRLVLYSQHYIIFIQEKDVFTRWGYLGLTLYPVVNMCTPLLKKIVAILLAIVLAGMAGCSGKQAQPGSTEGFSSGTFEQELVQIADENVLFL